MSSVYVVNATNLGITEYQGGAWDTAKDAAVYEGRVVVLNPDGVFEHTGDTDDGTDIDANFETGALNFGSPDMLKRLREVRVYGDFPSGGRLIVIEYKNGQSNEYTYSVRATNGMEAQVVRVGGGLRAEAFGFRLTNMSGGDIEVRSWSVLPFFTRAG